MKFKNEEGLIVPIHSIQEVCVVTDNNTYLYGDNVLGFGNFPVLLTGMLEGTLWVVPEDDIEQDENPYNYFIRKFNIEEEKLIGFVFQKAVLVKYIGTSGPYLCDGIDINFKDLGENNWNKTMN